MLASKGRKENAMRSVKEYLEQVRKQADRVEDLKQDVQYLDDGMASIGSTSFCKTDDIPEVHRQGLCSLWNGKMQSSRSWILRRIILPS